MSRKTRKKLIKRKYRDAAVNCNMSIYTYMLVTTKGLEDIAKNEIISKISNATVEKAERGKIFVKYSKEYNKFFNLKTIENFYLLIGQLKIGMHKIDLINLPTDISTLNVRNLINEFYDIGASEKKPKIIVSASRSGKHTFSRYEAADYILESLCHNYNFEKGSIEDFCFAFRADINDDDFLLSLKLSPKEFKYRGNKEFSKGALKPAVAHAMVLLSNPTANDVFLDPFCGSGTIPYERHFYPYKKIIASDISKEAIIISKANLKGDIEILEADACFLPFESHSVSKIVTNPPWDVQIKVDDIQKLYIDFLNEAKRILVRDGIIVMLTDKENIIKNAAEITHFEISKISTVSLHGLLPSIYILKPSI